MHQEFTNWTVNTIREDKLLGSWMEERKFDWIPLVSKAITNVIDKNKSVLIITDDNNEWFMNYILTNINKKNLSRPFLPFYDFNSFRNIDTVKSENDVELIHDMLSISFPNGYFFWYIGKSQSPRANLAKISKKPFLWLMDDDLSNSFYLDSSEEALDIRLLNMFRLFNKTLDAALFAQIDVLK
ncbi:MAG: HobA family DNA replication regulator [Campylobacterota bacterium]|nr:HobA family DNA replication regulator [Campylobacterota bacterium]